VLVRRGRAGFHHQRRKLGDELRTPGRRERRGDADELQARPVLGLVPQAEQQRAQHGLLRRRGLVQAVARQDDVGSARVLDLQHGALVRRVRAVRGLGDDAVEAGALERAEPLLGHRGVLRARGGEHERTGQPQPVQGLEPFGERPVHERLVAQCQDVEHDQRGGGGLGEHLHARRRRVDALRQQLEVESRPAARRGRRRRLRDDDLAVDHAPLRERLADRRDDVREVAVHRLRVPGVDPDLVPVAVHDGAEAVPLRLVDVGGADVGRRLGGDRRHALGEHRPDRWLHGQVECGHGTSLPQRGT
jgi:hypothetical protein